MASLHYKFAAMNSGKSTQLIQAHFNYCERALLIKSKVGPDYHHDSALQDYT